MTRSLSEWRHDGTARAAALTDVVLEANPAAQSRSDDDDRIATEASAQCTFELLMLVLPPGPLARNVQLKASQLCARPVPMGLIFAIIDAVCRHTGFGDSIFTDDVGAAVIAAIGHGSGDDDSIEVSGGASAMSLPAARLQFFQRLSAQIRQTTHTSTPKSVGARQPSDPEAAATARAIVVEFLRKRAPLALNEFLQDFARAAALASTAAPHTLAALAPASPLQSKAPVLSLEPQAGASNTHEERKHQALGSSDRDKYGAAREATNVVGAVAADAEGEVQNRSATSGGGKDSLAAPGLAEQSNQPEHSGNTLVPGDRSTSKPLSELKQNRSKGKSSAASNLNRSWLSARKVLVGVQVSRALRNVEPISAMQTVSDRSALLGVARANASRGLNKLKAAGMKVMLTNRMSQSGYVDADLVEEIFSRYDINGDNSIDVRELGLALKHLGFTEKARDIMSQYDDGDGEIDLHEFKSIIRSLSRNSRGGVGSDGKLQNIVQAESDKGFDHTKVNLHVGEQRLSANVPAYIRDPHSGVSMLWDGTQVLLLIWVAFSVTLNLAFNVPEHKPWTTWWVVDALIDFYFLVDIGLAFVTAYFDHRGVLQVDCTSIAMQYVFGSPTSGIRLGWFWLDLVSGFPLQYIALLFGNAELSAKTNNMGAVKTVKIFKLAKLLKLVRITKTVKIFQRYEEDISSILMFCAMFVLAIWLMHTLACGWFWVGTSSGDDNCIPQPIAAAGTKHFASLLLPVDCNQGWVTKRNWDDPSYTIAGTGIGDGHADGRPANYIMYIHSFSDVFMRSEVPDTVAEKAYIVLAELFFNIIFGAVAGLMFSSISSLRVTREEYQKKISELKEFGHSRGLGKPLQSRLIAFNRFLYDKKTVFDEKAILTELPLHLRAEVVYAMYGDMIKNSFFFLGMEDDESAVMKICMELRATAALEGDDIYLEGEVGEEMYFLQRGSVLLTSDYQDLRKHAGLQSEPAHSHLDERNQKAYGALLVHFDFGSIDADTNHIFLNQLRKEERANLSSRSQFQHFRRMLESVTGVYKPVNADTVRTAYHQVNSSVNDADLDKLYANKALGATGDGVSSVSGSSEKRRDLWSLEFVKPKDLLGRTVTRAIAGRSESEFELEEPVGWTLSNSVLQGTLDTEGMEQSPLQVPMGRTGRAPLWRWRWKGHEPKKKHNSPRSSLQQHDSHPPYRIPESSLPVSIVEAVELLQRRGNFGELEMLRLCGGASGRVRQTSARAMEDSHLSTLNYTSYCNLKEMFPREMANNERFFMKKAAKRGRRKSRGRFNNGLDATTRSMDTATDASIRATRSMSSFDRNLKDSLTEWSVSQVTSWVQDQVGPELAAGVIEKGIDGRLLGFMDNDAWKELGATALQAVQLRVAVQELLRAINSS